MVKETRPRSGLLPLVWATAIALAFLFGAAAAYGWMARDVTVDHPELLAQVLDHINGWIGWALLALVGVPLAPAAGRGIMRGVHGIGAWRSGRYQPTNNDTDGSI
jgi:hypothetical protein